MFENCPLCLSSSLNFECRDEYTCCQNCDLIFRKPKSPFLGKGEKDHYLKHKNGPQFPGYVSFLKQAVNPLLSYLQPTMKALDFGCGPGPTIDSILHEYKISCDNYDPFFFQDGIKSSEYDLIFATECVEHFHFPKNDFDKIYNLLKPQGFLSIMTELHPGLDKVSDWYYIKDPTHTTFFSNKTMKWFSEKFLLKTNYTDEKRVIVFQKP